MKMHRLQIGLTLFEMLVSVVIVAVLAGMVLTTLARIDSKAKEQLCEGTLETLNTALRQFHDYGYEYKCSVCAPNDVIEFYRNLTFPPDCNDYSVTQVEDEITNLLNLSTTAAISPTAKHQTIESGSAVMYFFLSRVPQCRETLGSISAELLKTDHNNDKDYMEINLSLANSPRRYPWTRVVDPWGMPLRYDYYANEKVEDTKLTLSQRKQTIRNFPLITSAGPDKTFDTSDDITNRDKTKSATYQN